MNQEEADDEFEIDILREPSVRRREIFMMGSISKLW